MFILHFTSQHFCFATVVYLLSPFCCRLVAGPGIGWSSRLLESGSLCGHRAWSGIIGNWQEERICLQRARLRAGTGRGPS